MKQIQSNRLSLRSLSTFLRCAASCSVLCSSVIYAETLETMAGSKAMHDFEISGTKLLGKRKGSAQETIWLRGIDPESNFAAVWESNNAPHLLLNWAGAKLPYMHYKRPHASRKRELVLAEVELSTSQRDFARLAIMVPHPSISPLVEANVFEEFRRFRPPMLEVVSEKPVTLPGGTGTLYEHKKGGGSLIIPISHNGLIRLTTVDFNRSQFLIEIAKGLDIERLNRKLDS